MSYQLHDIIVWEDDKADDNIRVGVVSELKRRGAELVALALEVQKGDVYTVTDVNKKTTIKSKEVLGNITTDTKITGAIHLVGFAVILEE